MRAGGGARRCTLYEYVNKVNFIIFIFFTVDEKIENEIKGDKEIFEKLEEDSNFNEQVLNVNALESNATVDEITNEMKDNEEVLGEHKENLNCNKQVSNISAIEGNVNNYL